MSTEAPKKIFLSHKSSDKNLVLDFKETLDLLGYETWLDDEAMPAGTELQRGLLQGMKESCAVVFFITPSFEDERFLRSEINYAIREKLERGDDFSIITLQFIGGGGERASIPELLKDYVWKTPKTDLEALREIIRALPVVPGSVEWRDENTTVATRTEMPSRIAGLSEEAKALLREAVDGDGEIRRIRILGGQIIQVSRKSLIPDDNPRTIARWLDGLKELQRCQYIECSRRGKTSDSFKVTREGYDAADEML